jgi:hypothetical protein
MEFESKTEIYKITKTMEISRRKAEAMLILFSSAIQWKNPPKRPVTPLPSEYP